MRTWWIIRVRGKVEIYAIPAGWLRNLSTVPPHSTSIGPYFSYKEAMNVLHVWSK